MKTLLRRAMRFVRTAIFLMAALTCSRICGAQGSQIYAGGAFAISPWSTRSVDNRTPSTTFLNESDDTKATAIVGEVGWLLGRKLAIGVEITLPFGRNTITQTHGYFSPYHRISRSREQAVLAVARAQIPSQGRVHAWLVGGGGFVLGSSLDQISRGTSGSTPTPVFGPYGAEQEMTNSNLGLTFGGDVVFESTRHVSIVPQFRVLVVRRGELGGSPSPSLADLGLKTVAYRAGIGLRAAF